MSISIYSLILVALLLLVLGAVGIGAIILVARRSNFKSDNRKNEQVDQSPDPWEEAGRRQQ